MSRSRPVPVLRIALRAIGQGIITMIIVPFLAGVAVLAVGHLAGACGPGSSGGCEMGAASIGFYAVIPGFVVGALWSVFRDLRSL
ncbi:MAG: hypothetical protein ACK4GT_04210 [Pararhodobacter sp.]